ncbi:MAG: hypothetical protein Q9175_007460 [Cornicularia normoerica]
MKIPKDPDWVGRRLAQHGMIIGPKRELDRYPEFKSVVEGIIAPERGSRMKPKSVQKFIEHRDYYQGMNEDSLLRNLIPLIIKQDYMRKLNPESEGTTMESVESEGREPLVEQQWVCREWFADGVATTVNSEFRKTLLPNKFTEELEDDLVKALAKDDGMKNAKPDYCYGIRIDKFSVPSDVILSSNMQYLLDVVPGMEHAFFIIEGKSNKGIMGDAQNQARRGGGTLVNAARKLLDCIGEPDIIGADSRTFVFSATMTSDVMDIYVHWAEVKEDQTLFHMTHLKSKALRDEDLLPELRAILHNILSWGCIDRFSYLTTVREKLYTFESDETARLLAESTAKKGNKRRRLAEDALITPREGYLG